NTPPRMFLKESVVAISTCMRAGRSARAQTMPQSVDTSPDCTPCVMIGRSAARLIAGQAIAAVEAETDLRNARRDQIGACINLVFGTRILRSMIACLVSRLQRSSPFAARSIRTLEPKGHQQPYDSSVAL